MTRDQYGISALVSQTSFRGDTSGGVAKCWLSSQATFTKSLGTLRSNDADDNENVKKQQV